MAEQLELDERQDALEEFVREGLSFMAKKFTARQKTAEERITQLENRPIAEMPEQLELDERQDALEEFVKEGLSFMAKKFTARQKTAEERIAELEAVNHCLKEEAKTLREVVDGLKMTVESMKGPTITPVLR